MVTGDVHFKHGKYKLKYENPQINKYINFVNRKTNKTINTFLIPKSIYVQMKERFLNLFF